MVVLDVTLSIEALNPDYSSQNWLVGTINSQLGPWCAPISTFLDCTWRLKWTL